MCAFVVVKRSSRLSGFLTFSLITFTSRVSGDGSFLQLQSPYQLPRFKLAAAIQRMPKSDVGVCGLQILVVVRNILAGFSDSSVSSSIG